VTTFVAQAPGKLNLCLFLGPVREDGRHELVTLYQSVSVADSLTVTVMPTGANPDPEPDQVLCPGVVPRRQSTW